MKNILFVGPFPPHQRGGGENAAYSLATAMKSRGHNVIALSMGKDRFYETYEDKGIKFYRVDKFYENRKNSFSFFQLFRYFTVELFNPIMFIFTIYLILKHKIDVVHISTFHQFSVSPLIATKILSRKSVVTFHSHELFCFLSSLNPKCNGVRKGKCGSCVLNIHRIPSGIMKNKIISKIAVTAANNLIKSMLFFNLKASQLADCVTFPSDYLRNFYIKYGFRGKTIQVVYNFVKSPKFSRKDVKTLKKTYGIGNEKIILFVGNMLEVKGPDVLLNAFKLLKRKKNLRLVFVGVGPFLERMKEKTSELGIEGKVLFTGFVPTKDLRILYSISDVVVIPSVFPETFSFIFLEAFSSGKIVVASDVGALSENISNGDNGFLVKPNDPRELAKKINYVISNSRNLGSIRKRAYNTAMSKYNPEIIVNDFKRLYS